MRQLCKRLEERLKRIKDSPKAEVNQIMKRFTDDWPYAMFLLMPVFALLMKLVYYKRGMFYGEHMVFAFHVHCAWFVLALLAALLPDNINGFAILLMPAYAVIAAQRVYGGRWWGALLRMMAVALPYLVAIGMVMLLLGFYVALA